MLVDAWVSEVQYAHHVLPIWLALDPAERGSLHVAPRVHQWATARGLDVVPRRPSRRTGVPIVVASWQDHQTVSPRPAIYIEHGAGQTYDDPRVAGHGSYSGGAGHDSAVLFLCPSETVADRWRQAYPGVPAVAVGVPKLDGHHRASAQGRKIPTDPVVAVTFHADTRIEGYLLPELRSAYSHYFDGLAALAEAFPGAIGHAHPRLFGRIRKSLERAGLEPVAEFAEVLDRASALAVDNSSCLFEFASTGRPVVVLDAPWYRADVSHGLRFWTWADIGPRIGDPADLPDAFRLALCDPDPYPAVRAACVAEVYAHTDGRAAERAVAAIRSVLGEVAPAPSARAGGGGGG